MRNFQIINKVYNDIVAGRIYKRKNSFEQMYLTYSGNICYDGYGRFCSPNNGLETITHMIVCHFGLTPQEFVEQFTCE